MKAVHVGTKDFKRSISTASLESLFTLLSFRGDVTTPQGCIYEGKHYPVGAKIESKNEPVEGTTNWCGGCYCLDDGTFECRDNFNCYSTTTTSEPIITQSTSSGS